MPLLGSCMMMWIQGRKAVSDRLQPIHPQATTAESAMQRCSAYPTFRGRSLHTQSSKGRYLHTQSCEADTCCRQFLLLALRLHHLLDGQTECLGELIVPGIMRRHCHDSSAAIAAQNVVCHPDRNVLASGRIDSIAACMG